MTWIVVVGSTLVMLLWILIYSFFMSSDFVHEVLILFGGVTFWATVLLAASIALGGNKLIFFDIDIELRLFFISSSLHREVHLNGVLPSR